MTWLGGAKGVEGRSGVITVLDVGSSKVCCIIARLRPGGSSDLLRGRTHRIQVIGIGHQRSQGIKSGVIVDLASAERSVRQAVDAAERMAGLTVESLIVNLTAGRIRSEAFSATVNLGGHETTASDIGRVLAAGSKQAVAAEREVIHSVPAGYSLDSEGGIRDPLGMIGDLLGVNMHVMTADAAPVRNLELCVNRAHLSVERMVATPFAAGLSALVEDEGEMGAACIDMGGGTTSLAVFQNGNFVHAASAPVGGLHVTQDLARSLSTSMEHAERLKVMHGSALPVPVDDGDMVNIASLSGDVAEAQQQIPRAVMNRIVRARIEEILEMIRDRLTRSGYSGAVGRRIVLTGGASQLAGLPEAARRVLGRSVRIGRPLGVAGLPEATKGPAFAAAIGLMIYPQVAGFENNGRSMHRIGAALTGTGPIQRVGQWIRNSF
jgi:cell division protein FtsA